ncbi:MAG: hypothetical protein K1X83_13465 [Oligoflexia bacterium]|nr:hypothetical protein [Oligoflexia bacterium]
MVKVVCICLVLFGLAVSNAAAAPTYRGNKPIKVQRTAAYGKASNGSFFSSGGNRSVYGVKDFHTGSQRIYGVRSSSLSRMMGTISVSRTSIGLRRTNVLGSGSRISGSRPVRR